MLAARTCTIADIDLDIRPDKRSRKLRLVIDVATGRVRLTCPPHATMSQVQKFVALQQDWVRQKQDAIGTHISLKPGDFLPFQGENILCLREQKLRGVVRLSGNKIYVPGAPESFERRVKDFLKQAARQSFAPLLDTYVRQLSGLRPDCMSFKQLILKDTRSRWGSCSSRGIVNLSWRLCMAPPHVAEYVIAHEVAHLAEPNHSSDFWDLVYRLYGNYDEPRFWLKTDGLHLFKYFTSHS